MHTYTFEGAPLLTTQPKPPTNQPTNQYICCYNNMAARKPKVTDKALTGPSNTQSTQFNLQFTALCTRTQCVIVLSVCVSHC